MYLRLDMYLNSTEYCLGEGTDFEALLNASDIIDSRIAHELREFGVSSIPLEYRDANVLNMLYDYFNIEVCNDDEVNFCMCLWNNDKHVKSAVCANEF